ncbi:MAG: MFS transporter [Gemmatimonadetes bacterium]|nr:MAG: MFS transporter [Gemmatimonadota bacterium]
MTATRVGPDESDTITAREDRAFFGHPRGLATLFFTEMWERFSYYGIRPLLVLFMTAALARGGFGFDRPTASAIVGIYAASVYLASLPGGWIADRWLGLQRAIWSGGVFIALGHLSIALSSVFSRPTFFLGLVLIVIGTGLLKPNVSAIVGDLYGADDPRRDAGFSVFYMGINTGALIAPIITGLLGERVGWHWGFGAAGVGMLAGLLTFRLRAGTTLGAIGASPTSTPEQQRRARTVALVALGIIALAVALAMAGVVPIDPRALAGAMRNVILTMALLYFVYLFLFAGLDADERRGIAVVLVLFVFSVVFWSAFEQQPTSLNLFARDFTDRRLGGWEVPTSWFQAAESVAVVLFAPLLAALWAGLARRGRDLSSPTKFALGLSFAGLGFLVMLAAANRVITGGAATRVSMLWLVASYFLQGIGELSLSPVGMSSMTRLAPKRFAGLTMGVWFTSIALGNLIAGLVGGNVDPEKLTQMPALFQRTAISLFVAAALLLALVVPIRRMMARTAR